jgi:hypothetical protein
MSRQVGGSLGHSLSQLLAETIIKATAVTTEHKSEHTRNAIDGWLEEAEEGYRPHLQALLSTYMESDQLPDELRGVFEAMAGPDHQFDVLLQLIGAIGAIISALFSLGGIALQPLRNELWADNAVVPIPPADLADMVERNIIGVDFGHAEAAKSGLGNNDFDLMVRGAGEPYGIEQGLNLLRRGKISLEEFTKVLYYSRVRNEFLNDVLALQWDTMTAGDAIEGALKGVLDNATASDLFGKAGGQVDQFQTLLDIAGNPIGVESALNLWNHGYINESQVDQIILHSRINPLFEQTAKLQRHKFLSAFQIVNAVKAGSATAAEAIGWLVAEGYPADQVTAVVNGSHKTATAAAKDITESQIATMYESGAITEQDASQRLVNLGYPANETTFILSVYSEKRHLAMIQAAIGQVRKVYLAGRIDDAGAGTQLDALGVDPTAKETYLTVWKIEAASELKELTAAQIGTFVKKGFITNDDATKRWEAMGYDAGDAALLLANYGGPPPPGSPAAVAAAATPTTGTTA